MDSPLRGFVPPSPSPLFPVPRSSLCSCLPAVVLLAFCFFHSSLKQSTTSCTELWKRGNAVLQNEVKLGINPTDQLSCGTSQQLMPLAYLREAGGHILLPFPGKPLLLPRPVPYSAASPFWGVAVPQCSWSMDRNSGLVTSKFTRGIC